MSGPSEPGYRLFLIIADAAGAEVLTVAAAHTADTVDRGIGVDGATRSDTWTLPSVAMDDGAQVRDWPPALAALTGSPVVVLRHETVASLDHDHPTLVVAEVAVADAVVAGGSWRPIRSLDLDRVEPILRAPIERWRARRLSGVASSRQPWSAPGWFETASAWMLHQLERAGLAPTGTPVQHYLWSIASVLRCPTRAGDAYLKAASPLFPREAAMTALLEAHVPGLTPKVIAVESDRGWLLMADHGGRALGDGAESTWAAGMAAHARIQAAWAPYLAEARAIGVPNRTLADLARSAVAIAEDDERMARLDQDMRDRYRQAVPRLVDACARLAAFGIADGLVHGDLHPDNVALTEDGCLVFDWSDLAIGMPFIDLVPYVFRSTDVATRRACRDAYLGVAGAGMDPQRAREAADLALPLGCLYQVVSYIEIERGLGDEMDDMADADLDWIGRTVRALDDGIDARNP